MSRWFVCVCVRAMFEQCEEYLQFSTSLCHFILSSLCSKGLPHILTINPQVELLPQNQVPEAFCAYQIGGDFGDYSHQGPASLWAGGREAVGFLVRFGGWGFRLCVLFLGILNVCMYTCTCIYLCTKIHVYMYTYIHMAGRFDSPGFG